GGGGGGRGGAAGGGRGGGLGRGGGGGVGARHERVLGGHEHDGAAAALGLEHPEGLAGGQEVAPGQHGVVALPVGQRGLGDRRARGQPGGGHQDVEPAVLEDGAPGHVLHRGLVGHVDVDGDRPAR